MLLQVRMYHFFKSTTRPVENGLLYKGKWGSKSDSFYGVERYCQAKGSTIKDVTTQRYSNAKYIDLSKVTSMKEFFKNQYYFDSDTSYWDLYNVRDLDEAFLNCRMFKGVGSMNWRLDKVVTMKSTFRNNILFDGDIDYRRISGCRFVDTFSNCMTYTGRNFHRLKLNNSVFYYMYTKCYLLDKENYSYNDRHDVSGLVHTNLFRKSTHVVTSMNTGRLSEDVMLFK
jgi:hypothetical protein